MTLPITRVGQIEAEAPVNVAPVMTQPQRTQYVAHASRPPMTADEHLNVLIAGHKVYDLSSGAVNKYEDKVAVSDYAAARLAEKKVTTQVTISSGMATTVEILHDYPGCSIRDVASYLAAREGVPVRPVTRMDVWSAKQNLKALVAGGLAVSRYGENTSRYWLTEQGLALLQ